MAESSAPPAPRGTGFAREAAPFVLTALAVWLGWQIVLQPVKERGPVEAVIRVAPGSPLVLGRAAESELGAATGPRAAVRVDNAYALSRDALARTPFDVRALRIEGLAEARRGRIDQADDLLTLAGNWSLRDDPAHAWLIGNRLRRGDYSSALAHADTLARRREDRRPQIFQLFTTAAAEDGARALPVVTALVAARPPWRQDYLNSLYASRQGLQVATNLAIYLQRSPAPLTNDELRQLYVRLLEQGQVEAVRTVRARLNRPPATLGVVNGGFGDPSAPLPFQWTLGQDVGVAAEIMDDEVRAHDPALRVEYDGYASPHIAEQFLMLAPGRYRLSSQSRIESGAAEALLAWTVTCTGGDLVILSAPAAVAGPGWRSSAREFTVPANCTGQWLRLAPRPGERRNPVVAWFDRISVTPVA